jgi:serine/threonine protein kinase
MGPVWGLIGEYKHPGDYSTPREVWYECKSTNCLVYLYWEVTADGHPGRINTALDFALQRKASGVRIVRDVVTRQLRMETCDFIPFVPHFNSDLEPVVDWEDLKHLDSPHHRFPSHLRLVSFRGKLLAFKFMDRDREQCEFEAELRRYPMLKDCDDVPKFEGLVRKDGKLVGFLMTYIEGDNLYNLLKSGDVKGEPELLRITRRIVEIAAALEERDFYHQDLKLTNIVLRLSDRAIFFIDFGAGVTQGMFKPQREDMILSEGPEAEDALYTLGMTLWWLWNIDYQGDPLRPDFSRTKNPVGRDIIKDCIEGCELSCDSIKALLTRHYTECGG